MRVSTFLIHKQGVQSILDKQAEVLRMQNQASTGKRLLSPSDDPGAASRIIDLNEAVDQLRQYDENINYATQKLNLEESSLESSLLVLQRVRELSIQAANTATNDFSSQQAISSEIREKLDELLDYANARDEKGDYIFSGFQSKNRAFTTDGAGNYFYNGDQGQQQIQIGSSRRVTSSDSGADIFQLIRTGNGDFSVDANRANVGTGKISTGSVQSTSSFLHHDYTIRFVEDDRFDVIDETTGLVVAPASRPYNEGTNIVFDGIEIEISGTPARGDEFTVIASRNQDVFSTINNLVAEMEALNVTDIMGSIGGNYAQNGFQRDDQVSFQLQFDGRTVNFSHLVTQTDSDQDIAEALLFDPGNLASTSSFSEDPFVTDNLDGTYTLAGTTPGVSLTMQRNPVTQQLEFRASGGNGGPISAVSISNFTDTFVGAGPDTSDNAVLDFSVVGNTNLSQASISSAVTGDAVVLSAGSSPSSLLSQKIDNALNNINRVMDSIINVQTKIGGRLNSIDSQLVDNEARSVKLKNVKSEIEDLDLAEAISKLTFDTTALQVAQQTFVRIQGLNLFEFI